MFCPLPLFNTVSKFSDYVIIPSPFLHDMAVPKIEYPGSRIPIPMNPGSRSPPDVRVATAPRKGFVRSTRNVPLVASWTEIRDGPHA
ncbi:hypothetical protein J1614_000279 [Plenodomus biglobosus]|nr:hypothetical protein J1614_000279 [Plenodomus biglobosus]